MVFACKPVEECMESIEYHKSDLEAAHPISSHYTLSHKLSKPQAQTLNCCSGQPKADHGCRGYRGFQQATHFGLNVYRNPMP